VNRHAFSIFWKKQCHPCEKGDLAEYLLVPGDPNRVAKIVKFWVSSREVSCHREFRSFTGAYKGVSISALSSGIGPACMAIVVNEAAKLLSEWDTKKRKKDKRWLFP